MQGRAAMDVGAQLSCYWKLVLGLLSHGKGVDNGRGGLS